MPRGFCYTAGHGPFMLSYKPMDNTTPNPNPMQAAPSNRQAMSGGMVALIILALLVILGAIFLFVLRRPNQPTMGTLDTTITDTPTTTIPTGTSTAQNPMATSTQATSSTSPGFAEDEDIGGTDNAITLGETFQIFKGDTITILQPKREMPRWNVTAKEFSDSRCPAGVQCIWAGEQSVTLIVTDLIARTAPMEITLGTARNKSLTTYGLTLTLSAIEDGKGGTYAEIETK